MHDKLKQSIENDKKRYGTQCAIVKRKGLAIVVQYEIAAGLTVYNMYTPFGALLNSSQTKAA